MCKSSVALMLGIAAGFAVLTMVLSVWSDDAALFAVTTGSTVAILPMLLDRRKSGRCCFRHRTAQADQA